MAVLTLVSGDGSITITPDPSNPCGYDIRTTAGGGSTSISAGTNVTITGSGTVADPYVIGASAATIAGDIITFAGGGTYDLSTLNQVIQAGTNVTITGTGTAADPYIINATAGAGVDGVVDTLTYDQASNTLTVTRTNGLPPLNQVLPSTQFAHAEGSLLGDPNATYNATSPLGIVVQNTPLAFTTNRVQDVKISGFLEVFTGPGTPPSGVITVIFRLGLEVDGVQMPLVNAENFSSRDGQSDETKVIDFVIPALATGAHTINIYVDLLVNAMDPNIALSDFTFTQWSLTATYFE